MAQQNKKITELPLVEAADGLLTLGVNSQNESVQIPLGDLLGKINNTKKNKDFVMTMTYDKITTDEGAEFNLVDTEWDALADIVSNGECDIVLRDGIRNAYQLDHVFLSDGMPFGYKILPNNRTLNIATVIDSASSTLKLVWKFNDNAVKYDELGEKPSINGVELSGNKTSQDLKLQGALRTSADLALSDDVLSLTDMAKKRLFIDLWNQAAGDYGRYNEETGYFELFEIYDIGWDEALLIYRISGQWDLYSFSYNVDGYVPGYGRDIRVLLPFVVGNNGEASFSADTRLHNETLQYLAFCRKPNPWYYLYFSVNIHGFRFPQLKKIYDTKVIIQNVAANSPFVFNMPNLVYAKFNFANSNYATIYFRANLDYECTNYLFTEIPTQNANGQCVFKLAANMYNRLNGTATDYASSGGTKEEWMALADLAAGKNITLATE